MGGIFPQGVYYILSNVMLWLTAACYNFISNSFDLGSKVVHKVITIVLLGNVCNC